MTARGLTQLQRFETHFVCQGENNCWHWHGARSTKGYGRFDDQQAHRFAYINYICAEIPEGQNVLHRCSNKPCVNPKHLYLGTAQENTDFAWKTCECKLGLNHELTHKDYILIRDIWKNAEIVDPRRNRRSPSQKEIAAKFGVSQAAISNIVNGKVGSGICKGDTGFTAEDMLCQLELQ